MYFVGSGVFICGVVFLWNREGSTKCIGKVIALYPEYDSSMSDFAVLEKQHLNIQRFDTSYSRDGYKGSTLIFDEAKITTKEDLRNLEKEMEELKLKKKAEKQRKKEMEGNANDDALPDDGGKTPDE